MATYAIGDVQGCLQELEALLVRLAFDPARDRLWFVGDLVNRGPDSLGVLRLVRSLGSSAIVVLGNHDLHLLCLAEGVGRARADDTLADVLNVPDRDVLLDWLRHRPLVHVQDDHVLVHAGLLPGWSAAKARELAAEVESALRAEKREYRTFLSQLYGGEPAEWTESLQGADRLRVIVNAMTRMRFCTPAGRMEFHAKGGPAEAPAGYCPWFEVPGRISADSTLVVGHWSALGLRRDTRLLALDTGCVWGGALSALRLEDRALFQEPSRSPLRPGGD
jgi:bis(5'-nucleosyl)-tetraphosphatase (symmetrical)